MKITIKTKEEIIIGEIIEKDVVPFGNSAHIILPKEYLNRKLRIIIPDSVYPNDEDEEDYNDDSYQ